MRRPRGANTLCSLRHLTFSIDNTSFCHPLRAPLVTEHLLLVARPYLYSPTLLSSIRFVTGNISTPARRFATQQPAETRPSSFFAKPMIMPCNTVPPSTSSNVTSDAERAAAAAAREWPRWAHTPLFAVSESEEPLVVTRVLFDTLNPNAYGWEESVVDPNSDDEDEDSLSGTDSDGEGDAVSGADEAKLIQQSHDDNDGANNTLRTRTCLLIPFSCFLERLRWHYSNEVLAMPAHQKESAVANGTHVAYTVNTPNRAGPTTTNTAVAAAVAPPPPPPPVAGATAPPSVPLQQRRPLMRMDFYQALEAFFLTGVDIGIADNDTAQLAAVKRSLPSQVGDTTTATTTDSNVDADDGISPFAIILTLDTPLRDFIINTFILSSVAQPTAGAKYPHLPTPPQPTLNYFSRGGGDPTAIASILVSNLGFSVASLDQLDALLSLCLHNGARVDVLHGLLEALEADRRSRYAWAGATRSGAVARILSVLSST